MPEPSTTTTTVQTQLQGGIIILETERVCKYILYIAVLILDAGVAAWATWASSQLP
jgi:hypothetical protein